MLIALVASYSSSRTASLGEDFEVTPSIRSIELEFPPTPETNPNTDAP